MTDPFVPPRAQPSRWDPRPDWPTFVVLVALALALFAKVGSLPDYRPEHEHAPPSARGDTRVQDFAYVFNYARRAVRTPGTSFYSVEQHRAFLDAWMGPEMGSALCFAYSPIAILLLMPLFPLSTAWAWLAWNVVGSWLAACALRRLAGSDRILLGLGRMALISINGVFCLALGQTALFTTGVLALVLLGAPATWPSAAGLFLLAMKPPLALVAGAALLASGAWRPVAVGVGACALVLAAAVAYWNGALLGDYVTLVARYNLVEGDPLFRAGFVPSLMSNLRNVFLSTGWLDDAQAARASTLLFVAALAVPVGWTLVRRKPLPLADSLFWAVMAYVLFSPHLSGTEDLVLVVPMCLLWRSGRRLPAALCLVPQFVGGGMTVLFGAGARAMPLAGFAAKLAIVGLASRPRRDG